MVHGIGSQPHTVRERETVMLIAERGEPWRGSCELCRRQ